MVVCGQIAEKEGIVTVQHENDLNERSKFHFDSDLINEVVGFTRMAQQIVIEALIKTNNDKMAAVNWLLKYCDGE